MRIIKYLVCLVAMLFAVTGDFATATESVHGVTVPSLEKLIDHNKPYGLNLKAVDVRQNILRDNDKVGKGDVSVEIMNLMALKDRLTKAAELNESVINLKSEMKVTQTEIIKAKKKDRKKLEEKLGKQMLTLTQKQSEQTGYKNIKFLASQILLQKNKILDVLSLAPYNVTSTELGKLPGKVEAKKQLNYEFGINLELK